MRRRGVALAMAALLGGGLFGLAPAAVSAAPSGGPAAGPSANGAGQGSSSGWQPNPDDSWLLDLRSGRYQLGQGVRGYQTDRGLCVDLADMILALDLPVQLDKKSRRATGWVFDERQTLVIDRDAGRADYAGRTMALSPVMIRDTPEGWCIDVPTLGTWLGVTLKPDLGNAVLLVESSEKLPFEVQAERRARAASIKPQRRFDLDSLTGSIQPYSAWTTPSVDIVANASATRDAARGSERHARFEIYAAGELAMASLDARLASDDAGVPATLRMRAYRADPKGGLLGPLGATMVAAGDVSGFSTPLVAAPTQGRGAMITNRPLEQPDSFDRTSFRGDLPNGWDAELYRNGQLLAFASAGADGRYEFADVPLLYGNNRFEIVLYGPQGQIRRESRVVPVGVEALPPGKTWYWAGLLDDGRDLISIRDFARPPGLGWRGSFGAERGIGPRTSVAGMVHSLRLDGIRRTYAEVALRQAAGSVLFEFSGAQGLGLAGRDRSATGPPGAIGPPVRGSGGRALRAQLLGDLGRASWRAESIRAWGGYRSDRIDLGVTGLHSLSLDHAVKLGSALLPVRLETRYITRQSGSDALEMGARMSTAFRNLSLTASLDWRHQRAPRGFAGAAQDAAVLSLLGNMRLGRWRLRGEAQVALAGRSDSDRFTLVGERAAGERGEWRAEIGYEGDARRARAGLSYARHFKAFSLAATGEVASDGSYGAGLSLAFSLGRDPRRGGLRITGEKLASQGQLLARVWRDTNADGVWQPDEPAEPGVMVAAGTRLADDPTGKDGQALVDGLMPHRRLLVGIDLGSLTDPLLQPGSPGVVVTPRPGIVTTVALPLVPAGEVEGMLESANGRALAGVTLELVDAQGQVRATATSDFDGAFLFESVPYGRYQLRVAATAAQIARLKPDLGRALQLGAQARSVRLGTVVAERGTPAPPLPPPPVQSPLPPIAQSGSDPAGRAANAAANPAQRGKSFIYSD